MPSTAYGRTVLMNRYLGLNQSAASCVSAGGYGVGAPTALESRRAIT
jgi:hypothetical protein